MKILLLAFFTFLSLSARENPFLPSPDEFVLPITSNKSDVIPALTSTKVNLPDTSRVLQKVIFEYKNLDGSVDTITLDVDRSIDWHLPVFISQSFNKTSNITEKKDVEFKHEIADFGFISFFLQNSSLKINTKDKLLRHFILSNPHRLIVDFKADYNFETKNISINKDPYVDIKIGNHRGYYRVVITLDGKYKVNVDEKENSFIIDCY